MKKALLSFTLIFVCLSLQSQSIQTPKLKIGQWGKQKVVTCSNQDFSLRMVARAQKGQQKGTKVKQLKINDTSYELLQYAGLTEIRDQSGTTYLRTNAGGTKVFVNGQLYVKNTKGFFGKRIEYLDSTGALIISGMLSGMIHHNTIKLEASNLQTPEVQYLLALCFEELMQRAWDAHQANIITTISSASLISY